jgi:hypothetical protein
MLTLEDLAPTSYERKLLADNVSPWAEQVACGWLIAARRAHGNRRIANPSYENQTPWFDRSKRHDPHKLWDLFGGRDV